LGICLVGGTISGGPAAVAQGSETPPRNLHMEGDHWTAWNPPDSYPEGSEIHVIERGDTLWNLATRFYGDPYLWPQLWERNQYILDAHWIYPGDPLLIGVEVVPVDDLADLDGDAGQDDAFGPTDMDGDQGDGILTADAGLGPPVPLGSESDIYCTGYVGADSEEFPYQIIGSEHGAMLPDLADYSRQRHERDRRRKGKSQQIESRSGDTRFGSFGIIDTARYGMADGDIVYLDGGRDSGLRPGQLYTIIEPEDEIVHPVTGRNAGRFYSYQGRLQVLSVQAETAMAEIVHSCKPVVVGNVLTPFEPQPLPLGRKRPMWPLNYPADLEELREGPVILYANSDVFSLGQDHVVYIDRGLEDDVLPGDRFTVYRINRPGLPPIVLGELAVLSSHETSAVARILESRHTILVGDVLASR
jgi:hypothetical protein